MSHCNCIPGLRDYVSRVAMCCVMCQYIQNCFEDVTQITNYRTKTKVCFDLVRHRITENICWLLGAGPGDGDTSWVTARDPTHTRGQRRQQQSHTCGKQENNFSLGNFFHYMLQQILLQCTQIKRIVNPWSSGPLSILLCTFFTWTLILDIFCVE